MSLLENILGVLYPKICGVCKSGENVKFGLCSACRLKFLKEADEKCPLCHKTAPECKCGSDFTKFTKTMIGTKSFLTLTFYESASKHTNGERITESLIYALKEKCVYVDFFADIIQRKLLEYFDNAKVDISDWILTYPPRSGDNFIKYGFDQSEEIVCLIAKKLGIKYSRCFARYKGGIQKKLSEKERMINVQTSLVPLKNRITKGGKYIVFDDIITSGSTMITAARYLYFNGAAEVFPISIARTALR